MKKQLRIACLASALFSAGPALAIEPAANTPLYPTAAKEGILLLLDGDRHVPVWKETYSIVEETEPKAVYCLGLRLRPMSEKEYKDSKHLAVPYGTKPAIMDIETFNKLNLKMRVRNHKFAPPFDFSADSSEFFPRQMYLRTNDENEVQYSYGSCAYFEPAQNKDTAFMKLNTLFSFVDPADKRENLNEKPWNRHVELAVFELYYHRHGYILYGDADKETCGRGFNEAIFTAAFAASKDIQGSGGYLNRKRIADALTPVAACY